tara:strand:+ start:129 stop:920 length:792 start_codon:yes stop_codon:yes gene_type:complete
MMRNILIISFLIILTINKLYGDDKLTISVASSLYNVSKELIKEWEKTNNIRITIITGSTPLLARQIDRGQKSDIIITANYSWLKWMIDKNLIEESSIKKIAKNSLVFITGINKNIYLDINSIEFKNDLIEQISSSKISIPHPSTVPLGIYSKQALKSLDAWSLVQEKLVFTSSAQSNLKFISQGEANIGISYLSDALLSSKVKIISYIDNKKFNYDKPTYWAAKINKINKNNDFNFLKWLESQKGQEIFKNYGFETIYLEEND